MNVKNETARILRAHAERAASANALVKIYFKLYILKKGLPFCFVSERKSFVRLNIP